MNKKLTAKVQKISPKLENESYNISNTLVISPDDELTQEKKGTLYVVFDISSKKLIDTLLVTKVVNDVLHDSYFQSDNAAPLQAIEKAILKLRDSITNLIGETPESAAAVFNTATAVLWGNTLYLVQYGSTNTYLMREGNIKPIEAATEGKFSVASGVVRDGDVIILATENFAKRYPPERLLGETGLGPSDLDELESGMILKFIVVKEMSQDEMVDFSEQPKEHKSEPQTVHTIVQTPKTNLLTKLLKALRNLKNLKSKIKTKTLAFVLLGLLAAGGLMVAISKTNKDTSSSESQNAESDTQETTPTEETDKGSPFATQPDLEADKKNKVVRQEVSVFYDLKITDTNAAPTDLAVTDTAIITIDGATGKVYKSDIAVPKFIEIAGTFVGGKSLTSSGDSAFFIDNEGFKALNTITDKITETYTQSELGTTATYLDFIYSVVDDKINKYVKEADGSLTESLWTQNAEVEGATGMGIDVSIFVLTPNALLKFTTGVQDDFSITGLDTPLNNAVKLIANQNLENVYIADAGNKRILVVTKDGALVKQVKLADEVIWSDIKSLGVNADETKAFVLNGTTVYEVDLTKEPAI